MKLRSYLLHEINLISLPKLRLLTTGPTADEMCLSMCVRLSVFVLFCYKVVYINTLHSVCFAFVTFGISSLALRTRKLVLDFSFGVYRCGCILLLMVSWSFIHYSNGCNVHWIIKIKNIENTCLDSFHEKSFNFRYILVIIRWCPQQHAKNNGRWIHWRNHIMHLWLAAYSMSKDSFCCIDIARFN